MIMLNKISSQAIVFNIVYPGKDVFPNFNINVGQAFYLFQIIHMKITPAIKFELFLTTSTPNIILGNLH